MRVLRSLMHAAAGAALSLAVFAADASAAEYPAPKEGTFVAKDFRFHTGDVLPEVRLHYRTVGEPSGEPVVILHGTGGSGASPWMPGNISSSCRMPSVMANPPSRPTDCGRSSPNTVPKTWSMLSTGFSPKVSS